jgi:acetamidase/formamidase
MPSMQTFTRDQTTMLLDPAAEAIGSVRDGERFRVETADSLCCLVKSARDTFDSFTEIIERLGGACPLTGPIHVDGAAPGDSIAMTVEAIDPAPRSGTGWSTIVPGWGALTADMGYSLQDSLPPLTTMCRIDHGHVHMEIDGKAIAIPAEPFLGTVAVAPAVERRRTLSQSHEYLGDVDLRALGVGSTVILPVNVEGALLAVGDAHAAQGDGEVTGIAVEIEADVELTVRVLPASESPRMRLPALETEEEVGVIAGFMGVPLESCVRAAYVDLCHRLERHHGFSRLGAYTLLGQAGRIQVGNMIDPFYSCLVSIKRDYL